MNGIKAELRFKIDSSKRPIWIDLIAYEKETKNEKARIKGIIKFTNENNAEILLNFNGNRFNDFDAENEQSVLKLERKK